MEFLSNDTFESSILSALIAEDGLLDGAQLALFQNNVVATRARPIDQYTVATYSGYAIGAVTWLGLRKADDGAMELVGTVPEFIPNANTVGNTIYGALLLDAGNALVAAGNLDVAAEMRATTDSIIITVRVRLTASGLGVVVS